MHAHHLRGRQGRKLDDGALRMSSNAAMARASLVPAFFVRNENVMSFFPRAADGADHHRLTVETDADPNLLLRLLEPFVIHAVLPTRIGCATDEAGLRAEIEFRAAADLAERLQMRLEAMVAVRRAELSAVRARPAAAA